MHRFFVSDKNIIGERVIFDKKDLNHIKNVLRKKRGECIQIFDEKERLYLVEITNIGKQKVEGKILKEFQENPEPTIKVHIYQAIPKSNKIEFVIQKSVEIGCYSIVPIVSERTIVKPAFSYYEKKIDRWQKIAKESSEQSGRTNIPKIFHPKNFADAVSDMVIDNENIGLILWKNENRFSIGDFLKKNSKLKKNNLSINLFIGPEGGFTMGEIEMACKKGLITLGLGKRIFRTETAGLVALSIILYEYGELKYY